MSFYQLADLSLIHCNTWFVSTRGGDTGQGHTWETCVAKKIEDNIAVADIYETEIKTTSSKSMNPRLRMFTNSLGCERNLFNKFSSIATVKPRLTKTLRVNKPAYNWKGCEVIEIVRNGDRFDIMAKYHKTFVVEGSFNISGILPILENKIHNLAIINTIKKKSDEGQWSYRYPSFEYFGDLDHSKFIEALSEGQISIEFRLSSDGIIMRDNGTSFNCTPKVLRTMYRENKYWNSNNLT